ncbi:hypothetical protein [Pseudomonas luteola]|uniref:hypothetical protein n=1 Tax=Pseudomonas luteola TaxID=47886 RepID=UPI0015E2D1CC|nr:hypothetical protein [Pseudomonas zeshuii]MBA1250938.1 hypothetical protein [Pseudomonas zeshuii]
MADWLKVFRVGDRATVVAINEQPGGGNGPAIRLEGRISGKRLEETFHFESQAEADQGFNQIGQAAARVWVETFSQEVARA